MGTQLGYLRFQPAAKAFLDFDTGRYGMQPRHCCQGRPDRRRMAQKRPHNESFPMAKPRNRISGFRKPSKRDKRPQLFCEGSQARPRRRGRRGAPDHSWWQEICNPPNKVRQMAMVPAQKTAPNTRGVALGPPTSAVKKRLFSRLVSGASRRPRLPQARQTNRAGGRALKTE